MKRFLSCTLLLLLFQGLQAVDAPKFQYYIDINRVQNDEVEVTFTVPAGVVKTDEIDFLLPRTIPGTYEFYDYGRFVKSFKATCVKGTTLVAERTGPNTWKIKDAQILKKVTYIMEDTWDTGIAEKLVFEPAGTNFENDRNFIINQGAMFGYLRGFETSPVELTVDRPVDFYGSTSLPRIGGDLDTDVFTCGNYRDFCDNPMMFCRPDTAILQLEFTKVLISVYSPKKMITSKNVAKEIIPILKAQLAYMNYIIPVDKYTFIFYFTDKDYASKSIGALEHSRCSIFSLYETKFDKIGKTLRDFVSHEFFHVITPLYIHSDEIQNFDFQDPKMSEHLWLYEGVIEYLAQHVQLEAGITTLEQFLQTMKRKLQNSDDFNNEISFTFMSRNCLDPEYAAEYYNVYEKGAIIGFALDMLLVEMSDGSYNLRRLLVELAKNYGENKYFQDKELFPKIEELTFRQVGEFLRACVSGTRDLPLEDLCKKIGIEYKPEGTFKELSPLGGIKNGVLKTNDKNQFYINDYDKLDEFGRMFIKFKKGDVILTWNGEKLTKENAGKVILDYVNNAKDGDPLEIKVLRKDDKGVESEVVLKTKVQPVTLTERHIFNVLPEPDEKTLMLRKKWMK